MKTKGSYYKLKQLDRIESLLLKQEKKYNSLTIAFIKSLLPLILIAVTFMMVLVIIVDDPFTKVKLLSINLIILKLVKLWLWVFIAVDIAFFILQIKKNKRINAHLKKMKGGVKENGNNKRSV